MQATTGSCIARNTSQLHIEIAKKYMEWVISVIWRSSIGQIFKAIFVSEIISWNHKLLT